MAEYRMYFRQVAGTMVKVEADSPEEAEELAYEELPTSLCAYCAGWNNPPGIDLSGEWELDGAPEVVKDNSD